MQTLLLLSTERTISNQIANAFGDIKVYRMCCGLKRIRLATHIVFMVPHCDSDQEFIAILQRILYIVNFQFDRVKVFISHNVVHKKRNKMYINDLVTSQLVQPTKITAIVLPTTATLTKHKPSPIFGRIWWRMTTFDYPSGIQFVIANENDLIDFNAM